jgi:hypothetical protein
MSAGWPPNLARDRSLVENAPVAIDRSGQYWRGEDLADLAEYLRSFQAGGYPIVDVVESVCADCEGRAFRLVADDDEGCVQRICVSCGSPSFIADSADAIEDADLQPCECPCGGETFAVAVGFARHSDQEIRWVSVGLRCLSDGTLGVYADWKIDYSPSAHLLAQI